MLGGISGGESHLFCIAFFEGVYGIGIFLVACDFLNTIPLHDLFGKTIGIFLFQLKTLFIELCIDDVDIGSSLLGGFQLGGAG